MRDSYHVGAWLPLVIGCLLVAGCVYVHEAKVHDSDVNLMTVGQEQQLANKVQESSQNDTQSEELETDLSEL